MKIALTHRGWFGLCPVYFGNLDSDAPLIVERSPLFLPLFILSEALYAAAMSLLAALGQPVNGWPLRITGELPPGREIDVPEES